nr:T-lymphocyte activation antigen CD86 isoform X3 [Saimiri boliviensis boliviensis]
MDPLCTMKLSIIFAMTVLTSGADSLKIQAYFNETADLPCEFANSQNLSLSELVVFWQDQENLVLNEVYLGKEKSDSVHSKYMGRTSFDPDSWSLRLHNLQIKDKGLYRCIIHHKKPTGMIRIHQMNSDLLVLEIEELQPPPDHITWIAAVLLTIFICGMMGICLNLWKRKKKKKQPRKSYGCEPINMERGESEQTQKSVKIHEPERSDEAQHAFKSSKTPSCDESDTYF